MILAADQIRGSTRGKVAWIMWTIVDSLLFVFQRDSKQRIDDFLRTTNVSVYRIQASDAGHLFLIWNRAFPYNRCADWFGLYSNSNHGNALIVACLNQDFGLGFSIDQGLVFENQGFGFSQAGLNPFGTIHGNMDSNNSLDPFDCTVK